MQLSAFPALHSGIAQWRSSTLTSRATILSVSGPSEGVDEVQVGVHEPCGVLQLWVMADVLVQYGYCGSLDQFPKQRERGRAQKKFRKDIYA